jgi:hypothetical protein
LVYPEVVEDNCVAEAAVGVSYLYFHNLL